MKKGDSCYFDEMSVQIWLNGLLNLRSINKMDPSTLSTYIFYILKYLEETYFCT